MLVSVDSFSSLIVATGDARITHPQTPTKAQEGKNLSGARGAMGAPRARRRRSIEFMLVDTSEVGLGFTALAQSAAFESRDFVVDCLPHRVRVGDHLRWPLIGYKYTCA